VANPPLEPECLTGAPSTRFSEFSPHTSSLVERKDDLNSFQAKLIRALAAYAGRERQGREATIECQKEDAG